MAARSSGPLVSPARRVHSGSLASTSASISPSTGTTTSTVVSPSTFIATPNSTLIQGIARAVSEAVIQSLTPSMVSEQSTSASTLMETPVPDAVVNTSPNVTAGTGATVQGSVASVLHSLSGEPLTGVALTQPRDRPQKIFTSMSLPIDARVTTKLKAKISILGSLSQ